MRRAAGRPRALAKRAVVRNRISAVAFTTIESMRRAVALESCIALVAALILAPFQHVHHGDHDHDDASFIHAHFYAPVVEHADSGPEIEDPHDEHSAAALDTFTIVPTAIFTLLQPPQIAVLIVVLPVFSGRTEPVEERAHDPPALACSIPRAPPA